VKLGTEREAREALERIRQGADMAAEARRSVDPGLAARAGDTGLVSRAALDPALAGSVFGAAVGSIVGPVELRLGWAVARVVEQKVGDESGFAARRDSIAEFARAQLQSEMRSHLATNLRSRAAVTIDEGFLREVGKTGSPTEKDLDHPIAIANGKPIPYRAIRGAVERVARGHGAGAARIAFARAEVDRRLLEEEAMTKGLDRSPMVARTLPGIERNILAGAAAVRLTGNPGAGLGDPALRKIIERLRSSARIRVDRGALTVAERSGR
jgi:hypothetical protein